MRDWNVNTSVSGTSRSGSFVSYLWGIETRINCREAHSLVHVCILPMRDWNLGIMIGEYTRDDGLYLTYEGLKLSYCVCRVWRYAVCILPMRDWNKIQRLIWGCHNWVCILPMRDWNFYSFSFWIFFYNMFVSYLWGIETSTGQVWVNPFTWFVSYLWGIETDKVNAIVRQQAHAFVSYLWGIETCLRKIPIHIRIQFVSYLWGIETSKTGIPLISPLKFLSYLWGIETTPRHSNSRSHICVSILPMRDWN